MNRKGQMGPAAVLHAIGIYIISGFLIYFLIPHVDTYRIALIASTQLTPNLYTPLMLMFLYILIPFIWASWLFLGVFYIVRKTQQNRGVL